MSMMVSFVLSFFPRDVLDEILNLIESVSEDFPSYFYFLSTARCNKQIIDIITHWNAATNVIILGLFGSHG